MAPFMWKVEVFPRGVISIRSASDEKWYVSDNVTDVNIKIVTSIMNVLKQKFGRKTSYVKIINLRIDCVAVEKTNNTLLIASSRYYQSY